MESRYLNGVEDYFNKMVEHFQIVTWVGEELSKYKLQLYDLDKDIQTTITDVDNVLISDSIVNVVNLKGEKISIKSSQIKSLPKGIYIINGKKVLIR